MQRSKKAPAPRYVSTWQRLYAPVVLVTAEGGRELFTEVRPLLRRLDKITRDGSRILALSQGGRHMTADSLAGLQWYLCNLGLGRLSDLVGGRGRNLGNWAWDALQGAIGAEFFSHE
jgi:hypothetical protein